MEKKNQKNQEIVIGARNLVFKYHKGGDVFVGANFDIMKNEKVFFVGADGCGKTTLFEILSGLEKGWLGSLTVLGECPKDLSEGQAKNHIVYLPERPVFLENKTVRENLDFARVVLGMQKMTDEEFIKVLVGLGLEKDTKVKALGKVQKLKLEVMRAKLKNKIKLLLIDRSPCEFDNEDSSEAKQILRDFVACAETVVIGASCKADLDFFDTSGSILYYMRLGKCYLYTDFKKLEENIPELFALEFFDSKRFQKRLVKLDQDDCGFSFDVTRFEGVDEYKNAIDQMLKKRKNTHKIHEKHAKNMQNAEINAKNESLFVDRIKIKSGSKLESELSAFGMTDNDFFVIAGNDLNACLKNSSAFEKAAGDVDVMIFYALTGERVW